MGTFNLSGRSLEIRSFHVRISLSGGVSFSDSMAKIRTFLEFWDIVNWYLPLETDMNRIMLIECMGPCRLTLNHLNIFKITPDFYEACSMIMHQFGIAYIIMMQHIIRMIL